MKPRYPVPCSLAPRCGSILFGTAVLFLAQAGAVADGASERPECEYDLGSYVCMEPGKRYVWRKPENVRFVLITACGGGGGGGDSGTTRSRERTPNASGGGGGSWVETLVFGPIVADQLEIVVGAGGGSGQVGESTTVKAGERILVFSGGLAGGQPALNTEGTRHSSHAAGGAGRGAAGGRTSAVPIFDGHSVKSTSGESTPYASGGGAGEPYQQYRRSPVALGGAGGGAGIGPGGKGGDARDHGRDGGICAGGGGAGQFDSVRPGELRNGGSGGPGFVRIVPIHDTGIALERTTDLLSVIKEQLNTISELEKRVTALEGQADQSRAEP